LADEESSKARPPTPIELIERFASANSEASDREAFRYVVNALKKYLMAEGKLTMDEGFGLTSVQKAGNNSAQLAAAERRNRECAEMYFYLQKNKSAKKIDAARDVYARRDERLSNVYDKTRLARMVSDYTTWLEELEPSGLLPPGADHAR